MQTPSHESSPASALPGPSGSTLDLEAAELAAQAKPAAPSLLMRAEGASDNQQQDAVLALSVANTPTSMLLPVQHAPSNTNPQRVKYASQAAAYDSDLSEDASLLLEQPAAYDNQRPSDTEGILDDTVSAADAARVAAAAASAQDGTGRRETAPDAPAGRAAAPANMAASTYASSTSRGRSRVGSRTSSTAASRESSQQDVSQQQQTQQQLPPMQPAPTSAAPGLPSAGSEPPSLADWKSTSLASNSSQQHVGGGLQPLSILQAQLPQPQQQQAAAAWHVPSPLGSDSGLRNALAQLKPVRTTTDTVPGPPAAGNAAPRKFKATQAETRAAADAGLADGPGYSGAQAADNPAAVAAAATDETVMTPMYYKTASGSLLSLLIQRSTPLKPDLLVTNPVVRLHVVSAATGKYVRMVHQTAQLQEQQQQQGDLAADAAGGSSRSQGGSPARHLVERPLQDKMLESLGRPALTTVDNNTTNPQPALLDYIPPIQTRPYDMLEGAASSSSSKPEAAPAGLTAEWNEELCVDLSLQQLREADALLLLEVLQLPSGFARFQHHVQQFDLAGRSHPIAWGFLRLRGLQAQQQQLAQGKSLQLQLYQYKPAALAAVHAMSKGFSRPQAATAAKAAYLSWKMYGFSDDASDYPSSPRSPLKAVLGGLWGSRDGAAPSPVAGAAGVAGGLQQQQHPQQQRPGSPAFTRQGLDADKYPGFLQVVLTVKPRPAAEAMVVITDPAAGIRPDVPAGYGSGFEHGRISFGLLHKPRGLAGIGGKSGRNSLSGGADAGSVLLDKQLMFLESKLHRPHTQPCQVPNAVLVDIKGTAGGCSCIATSRDGRWLVAACADAAGRFKVNLYQALTGALLWVLGTHEGLVYSINWAKDDSAVITTSADFTGKVWHLPILPSPGHPGQGFAASGRLSPDVTNLNNTFGGTGSATAAAAEAAADAGVACTVLQHRCFVYAGELHPVRQPWLLAVTGAYDGDVRVWSAEEGTLLYSLQVSADPINCLAFNQLGSRMFTGDAAGALHELSVDVTPLASTASAAFGALVTTAAGDGSSSINALSSTQDVLSLNGGLPGSPRTPRNGRQQQRPMTPRSLAEAAAAAAAAAGTAESVSPVAAVLRHGSPVKQLMSGFEVLKVLRTSNELSGSPIVSVACHPGGHQLVALTKSRGTTSKSKGVSDLVVIDMKLFMVARRLGGVKCCSAPLKFGISPDGEHILCGSEDGTATIWNFETATATPVPHMALGGAPVYCMAWNNCFHAVAICSFSPYAPIRVLCYSPDEPLVRLNPPSKEAAAAKKQKPVNKAPDALNSDAAGLRRYVLPDQLTPHHVHALLADIRASAAQRGIYKQPDDPNGQHLVVKSAASPSRSPAANRRQHNQPRSPEQQQQQEARVPSSNKAASGNNYSSPEPPGRLVQVSINQASDVSANSNTGLGTEAAATDAKLPGGRNRENRISRISAGAGDSAAVAGVGGQPSTPKVVLNRKGAAAGGVSAPWLQQQ